MGVPGNANALLLRSAAAPTGYQISRSLRFNSADSAYLSRTPASAGNRKTWTWAAWVKRASLGRHVLFSAYIDVSNYIFFQFNSSDQLAFEPYTNAVTTAVFRDFSAWYHIVCTVDTTQATQANRVKIYVNGTQQVLSTSTGIGLNADTAVNAATIHNIASGYYGSPGVYTNGYLADVHLVDGQALDPTSFGEFDATTGVWVPKAFSGSYGTNGWKLEFADNSAATATTLGKDTSGNGNNWTPVNLAANSSPGYDSVTGVGTNPNNMFDLDVNSYAEGAVDAALTWNGSITFGTGKFYVICAAYGTSGQGPSSVSLVVNGTTYTTNYTTLRSNTDFHDQQIGAAGTFTTTSTGRRTTLTSSVANAELTSISCAATGGGFRNRIFAVVFVPSGVGDTSFADHVVVQNISAPSIIDSLVDSPTNYGTDAGVGGEVRGNYATLNPLDNGGITLTNGNLDWVRPSAGTRVCYSTIGVSSGKWYFESSSVGATSNVNWECGVATVATSNAIRPGTTATGWQVQTSSSTTIIKQNNNTSTTIFTGTISSGDIFSVALDMDNGRIWFGRNGTWLEGSPSAGTGASFTNLSGTVKAFAGGDGAVSGSINFGQRAFAYTAPSGFKALCTANLPTPVVTKPSTVMDVALYTGNGSARSITGLGFNPDLVWIKSRSAATDHELTDSVRGTTKGLSSNLTAAEATDTGGLTAFNSDGFSLGTDTKYNNNAATYVAWTWDAGSSTVTNTSGSISSQVRANATAGFSVVTYTGTGTTGTVGHGLGVVPSMMIVKRRDASANWYVYHSAIGNTGALGLNLTNATITSANFWNNTSPTSTVLTVSAGSAEMNTNGGTYVVYAFAPVSGYSSFGSYTGNGSTDGPYVYTGFRPRWIMVKASSIAGSWYVFDTARDTYNAAAARVVPNTSSGESTSQPEFDLLSNGFKLRGTDTAWNGSGSTYVWAAFAESPFAYSRAR